MGPLQNLCDTSRCVLCGAEIGGLSNSENYALREFDIEGEVLIPLSCTTIDGEAVINLATNTPPTIHDHSRPLQVVTIPELYNEYAESLPTAVTSGKYFFQTTFFEYMCKGGHDGFPYTDR